mmetsp:Transcript_45518/g.91883  ORF Transcript_45518/g.91883 Transcript_45518/m.91883 type:complete len:211 (+) Transcript_45518:221-853(+)
MKPPLSRIIIFLLAFFGGAVTGTARSTSATFVGDTGAGFTISMLAFFGGAGIGFTKCTFFDRVSWAGFMKLMRIISGAGCMVSMRVRAGFTISRRAGAGLLSMRIIWRSLRVPKAQSQSQNPSPMFMGLPVRPPYWWCESWWLAFARPSHEYLRNMRSSHQQLSRPLWLAMLWPMRNTMWRYAARGCALTATMAMRTGSVAWKVASRKVM